ncbi:MAG: 30S ribosomal protein S16 [Patescibacteria group bacterium]|jgi:small subunit ribosomal protein S16
MLRIRLRRTGKKHQPHYRLVVAEHTAPIQGKFVDIVGHYNPRSKELVVKTDEATAWMDKGAKPSNTVARLFTKHGMKHKQIEVHVYPERPGKKAQDDTATAPTPAAPAADATPEASEAAAEPAEPAKE